MIASKLLKNQVSEQEKVSKIIDFLCSDSGSHDYTINRREAETELGLRIEKPSAKQYGIIKAIYDSFSNELGFGQVLDPQKMQGAYAVRRGFIESIDGGSDYFVTEGRNSLVATTNGPTIKAEKLFEGWRHESTPRAPQIAQIVTSEGEVQYEQDDSFGL